jgi:hypothetical protein
MYGQATTPNFHALSQQQVATNSFPTFELVRFMHDHTGNDAAAYNRVLWEGTMGRRPYPVTRSGRDLRHHRHKLLKRAAGRANEHGRRISVV